MNITSIRPREDNVLVRLDVHDRDALTREARSAGGVIIPASARTAAAIEARGEATVATVVAAGPGHYRDKFLGREQGMAPDGSRIFVPMSDDLSDGARVVLHSPHVGDRVYSDERQEYRFVREHEVIAVLEEE